jgi:hypothetical protein
MAEGRRYENKEMQKRYDSTHPAKKESKPAAKESQHQPEESVEDVVAKHGPADHMEIHSFHGGHKHSMTHHDAGSAHDHVSKGFQEESMEQPQQQAEPQPMQSSGAIPTMA